MDEFDIHNRKRNLERTIERVRHSSKLSATNKRLIFDFHDECFSNGLSLDRVLFYLNRLSRIAEWLDKDFRKATKQDIKSLVTKIELTEGYREWTKSGYKVAIKRFYKWLEGSEEGYPDKVRWIKTAVKNSRSKLTNLLSREDVKKLVAAASCIRDRALISALYESGCRIGELLNIRLKDMDFDDYGIVIMVNGKTGPRRVRVISSVPHLSNWIENHPNRGSPNAPLWVNTGTTNHNKMMKYSAARKMLVETADRAGIEKPVNPHNFRKARATHLASKLTEAQMKEYFAWVQGSDMASIYVHLSGRDVDSAILRIHGKLAEAEEKKGEELRTKKCPRCYHENSPEAQFCNRCRLPLDEKAALELEKRKRELTSLMTPEIIEKMIEEKVKQMLKSRIS